MIKDIELETLINDVYEYYGFDFGSYSRASLKRRVERVIQLDGFTHFHEFLSKVRYDPEYYKRVVDEITVNVTEMFRDPAFYAVLRNEIYRTAGGKEDFSSYYIANYGIAKFNEELATKMVFSQHNLVSDNSFNEFDLILCRNVLIYFDNDLQKRVINLFDESLAVFGFLALGTKETLKYSIDSNKYKQLDKEKIWRKIK